MYQAPWCSDRIFDSHIRRRGFDSRGANNTFHPMFKQITHEPLWVTHHRRRCSGSSLILTAEGAGSIPAGANNFFLPTAQHKRLVNVIRQRDSFHIFLRYTINRIIVSKMRIMSYDVLTLPLSLHYKCI